jgi:hypothetical protein
MKLLCPRAQPTGKLLLLLLMLLLLLLSHAASRIAYLVRHPEALEHVDHLPSLALVFLQGHS